jgi:HEPN domain-containing protein
VSPQDTNKIPYALGAAHAYLASIEPAYADLGKRVQDRKAGGTGPLVQNPGELAPIVSNVALAIELYLKVLRIQDTSIAPRGHVLSKLFDGLDKSVKASASARYETHLAALKDSKEAPFVHYALKGVAPMPSTKPADDLEAALKNMDRSFVDWRYMYELQDSPTGFLYFNFIEAMAVVRAIRQEIVEFQGEAVVSLSRT